MGNSKDYYVLVIYNQRNQILIWVRQKEAEVELGFEAFHIIIEDKHFSILEDEHPQLVYIDKDIKNIWKERITKLLEYFYSFITIKFLKCLRIFLFCGDSNCPEWFLAESALLTKIASVKMKLVTQYILQNIVEGIDTSAKIFKMLEGSGFNQQEINSTIACVSYIVENSAKYDVSEQILIKELIDLGLPKENCEQLSKTFKQYKDKLQQIYENQVIRIGKAVEFHYGISKFIVSESVVPQKQIEGNRFIDTNITFQHDNGKQECCQFVIFPEQLEDMLNSFKKAQKLMMQL